MGGTAGGVTVPDMSGRGQLVPWRNELPFTAAAMDISTNEAVLVDDPAISVQLSGHFDYPAGTSGASGNPVKAYGDPPSLVYSCSGTSNGQLQPVVPTTRVLKGKVAPSLLA